jgi:fructokinase
MSALIGGVEGGGTKFLAAIAHTRGVQPPEVLDRARFDTTDDPTTTLGPIAEWFGGHELAALGIATFGPLDIPAGRLTDTPKPGWSGAKVRDLLAGGIEPTTRTAFDTDVNGAVLAEWKWGAARDIGVALYITVGTGIGGGVIHNGNIVHGLSHPEMGHITVPRFPGDSFVSLCPHHENCLEGLTSGAAIGARRGRPAADAATTEPIWDLVTHYLAHGMLDLIHVLSPEVIVVGGGVMQQAGLLDRLHDRLEYVMKGYMPVPRLRLPLFRQEAGLFGALALGEAVLP